MTAWFCKVGHHLGTTKQKNSKPLYGLLTALVYYTLPETARDRTEFSGRGWHRERTWTNRVFQTLTKWASADAEPRGACILSPEPPETGLYRSARQPGVRLNPVSCRGCLESQSHSKVVITTIQERQKRKYAFIPIR